MSKFKRIIYCDTDSIITTDWRGKGSKKLGELKLEDRFTEGIFLRAKFYGVRGNYEKVIAKGVFIPISLDDLRMMILTRRLKISKNWLIKLRMALQRNKYPLELVERSIHINIHPDGKRNYLRKLNRMELLTESTSSTPLKIWSNTYAT